MFDQFVYFLFAMLRSTTVETVICRLLDRFGIKDNPRTFALYEHSIEGDQEGDFSCSIYFCNLG